MSMLQASGRVNKTLVVAIALAGGGVMLYYGYTKLKSKKSRGPPTTRKLLPVLVRIVAIARLRDTRITDFSLQFAYSKQPLLGLITQRPTCTTSQSPTIIFLLWCIVIIGTSSMYGLSRFGNPGGGAVVRC